MESQHTKNDFLLVQVFPEPSWHSLPIERDATSDYVTLESLYTVIRERLSETLGRPIDDDDVYYSVHTIARNVTQRTATLDFKIDYVKEPLSSQCETLLNAYVESREPRSLTAKRGLFGRVYFIVTPALRDMARLYHRIVPVSSLLDYAIEVYDGRDTQLKNRILHYMQEIITQNEQREVPLQLVSPILPEELDDPLMILFVATRGDRVLGYCGCNLLRYRMELQGLLNATRDKLLVEDAPRATRYFMHESLNHLFEIKGLSVASRESGKNIALVLLYHAMAFIRDETITRLFPVSHLATQAASYVTKRLLMTHFRFAYHGMNQFMNETFCETLSQETKTLLTRAITEFTGYTILLLRQRMPLFMEMIRNHRGGIGAFAATPVLPVYRDAVHMYQLYYLLLQTTQRARAFDCYNRETLQNFETLFGYIASTLQKQRVFLPLYAYFESNRVSLQRYDELHALEYLEVTVCTTNEITGYGFLASLTENEAKKNFLEGYEVIYKSILSTVKLMHALLSKYACAMDVSPEGERSTMNAYLTRLLDIANRLVGRDLTLEANYEIPLTQIEKIRDSVRLTLLELENKAFIGTASMSLMRERLDARIDFLRENMTVNQLITNAFFNVDPTESDGFDMLLSHKQLIEDWPGIESAIQSRVSAIKEDTPPVAACAIVPTRESHIEVPADAATRLMDRDIVFEILKHDPPAQTEAEFRGRRWPIATLKEYLNRLMPLVTTVATEEEEEPLIIYAYEDMYGLSAIPMELDNESVFNKRGGFI